MSAEIIHVDFRTRRVRRVVRDKTSVGTYNDAPNTLDTGAVLRDYAKKLAVTEPVPEPPGFENLLKPTQWEAGSAYEATRSVPVKDIAKVVRAYVKDIYPLVKFQIHSKRNCIDVFVRDPGPVRVFAEPGSDKLSEAMDELVTDLHGFMSQFNQACAYGQPRFYAHVYPH